MIVALLSIQLVQRALRVGKLARFVVAADEGNNRFLGQQSKQLELAVARAFAAVQFQKQQRFLGRYARGEKCRGSVQSDSGGRRFQQGKAAVGVAHAGNHAYINVTGLQALQSGHGFVKRSVAHGIAHGRFFAQTQKLDCRRTVEGVKVLAIIVERIQRFVGNVLAA